MGGQRFDPGVYQNYQQSTRGKSTHQVFTQRSIHKDLNPYGVKVRESRDSDVNPNSTPIIVGLDVTGSMGMVADAIARDGLGRLFREIYAKKPVTDPHVMFMGIGDVRTDQAPLQVSQFEAGPQIIEQLSNIWLEGHGGGNHGESYQLPWYFAAFHTVHDSWEKRSKKGYLFTVGDEPAPVTLTRDQAKQVTSDSIERDLDPKILLQVAQRTYHVFHMVLDNEGYAACDKNRVYASWRPLLGENVIPVRDYTKLPEAIIDTITACEAAYKPISLPPMTVRVIEDHSNKKLSKDP